MKTTRKYSISGGRSLSLIGLGLVGMIVLTVSIAHDAIAQQPDAQYADVSQESSTEVPSNLGRKYMQEVSINENFVNAGILDVFERIESKTQFKFSYDNNDINKSLRFSIDARGMTVRDVLTVIANQTSLSFKQLNNDIIVRFQQKPEINKQAVEKTITGTITNQEGVTVPGVNVVLKGTAIGTVTGIDGRYSLNVPDDADTLIVSYIGYITQHVFIDGRTVIDVVIEEDVQALDEFVKIGYQTVRKSDLTGAVSVIDAKEAGAVSTNSVVESLQGLAPGVTVRNGGRPGQMGNIEIRGIGSFRNAAPLYIIDGMYADPNATINPNDIESIQILKDGSAAAIYGSRAANGVVIITTKKGQEGPTKVNVNAKVGLQQLPKRWDVMNAQEFAAMQRTQYENSGQIPPTSVGSDFNSDIDTDWQDEGFRQGYMQDYNVSLSGGSKNSSYMVSGSWFENKGVLIGNEFERASLRINSTSEKGMFFFGENLLLTHTTEEFPAEGNAFYDLPQLLPIIDVQNPAYIDEDLNPEGWGYGSPDAVTYAWNYPAINSLNKTYNNFAKIVGNAYAGLKFTDYLNYKFNVGVEASFDRSRNIRKDGIRSYAQSPVPNSITETRGQFTSVLLEHTVNFDKQFGLHEINAVAGFTQQESNANFTTGGRTDMLQFNDNYLSQIDAAIGEDVAFGGVTNSFIIRSWLGRINYQFDKRYLLTLTGRSDSDSRFGEEYRTGFFPSVAAGWRISNEDFFESKVINNLKLYGSYGILGINTIGPFEYSGFLNSNPRAVFGATQQVYAGAYMAQLFNPLLRWESRKMTSVGVTTSLWEDKLIATAEYYNNLSDDALVNVPLAGYLGNLGGNPAVNAASVRNSGFEFSATYRSYEKPFKWELSANLTTIKNEVVKIADTGEGSDYIQLTNSRIEVGQPIGEWYLIETDGIFQSESEVASHVDSEGNVIQPFAQPGDIRFVDHNNDGQITEDDRQFLGSPWPTLQTGMQFSASYRSFTLNVQLMGVFGHTIYNDVRRILDSYQNTNFRSDISPWTPTNTDTDDPRLALQEGDPAISDNNRAASDRWLEDGSYVRLRNIEIGYNLPSSTLKRVGFESVRVYVSAQNLLTFTNYSGLDPDVPGQGIGEQGFDAGNWPASRIFSIGLQCGF